MTRSLLKLTAGLMLCAVIVTAGAQTVLYVTRWQWARASFVGMALVASLVVGATVLVMARLDRVERRITAATQSSTGQPERPAATRNTVAGEPLPDLRWLEPPTEKTYVFIPVLLATGMVVSVLAAAVEHVAGAVARHRSVADPYDAVPPAGSRAPWWGYTAAVIGLAVVVTVGSLGLYQVAHDWENPQRPGRTELLVQVLVQDRSLQTRRIVGSIGRFCALNSGVGAAYRSVEQRSADTAWLRVSPALDAPSRQRFQGCVEDAVIDRVQLRVTTLRATVR